MEEEDDWELAPTQLAAPSQPPAAPERARCAVCALDVTLLSVWERTRHLNACLDASALRERFDCPSCARDLTDYGEQRRAAHVNLCLDRLSGASVGAQAAGDGRDSAAAGIGDAEDAADETAEQKETYACKICGKDLAGKRLDGRIRHVKQCGIKFGVRPSDLAAVLAEEQAPISERDAASWPTTGADADAPLDEIDKANGAQKNAFELMMTRAASGPASGQTRTVSGSSSNAFDVMMKNSRTVAVLDSSKRQRVGGWRGGSSANHGRSNGGWRRRTPSCPEFKRIKGTSPPFIVDGFNYASKELSSIYFLTHFHSDHYGGITKSFDCGVIYCNEVTGKLVVQELGVDPKFVHSVPMNRPVTIEGVEVTFMDANHCPGATIVLFRLKNGRVYLHTGDFRFCRAMLEYPPLRPYVPAFSGENSTPKRLDALYLDTTYADPKYTFPTQQAAITHALSLMDRHLQRNTVSESPEPDRKTLFLFGSYSLGKERLFMEVAAKFQRKVCVSKAKLRVIQTFGWPERQMRLLTTEAGATNLHVVPMQQLQMEHLTALLDKHRLRFHRIVAFRPTGWTFGGGSGMSTCKTDPTGNIRVYGVPYSEHSSFAELADCVRSLNALEIIPTVSCNTEQQVRKQINALRQAAFSNLPSLLSVTSKKL